MTQEKRNDLMKEMMIRMMIRSGIVFGAMVAVTAIVIGGLFAGAFTTSHPYDKSATVTTLANGQKKIEIERGYFQTGWKADVAHGQVVLSRTKLDSMETATSDGAKIDLPSVAVRSVSFYPSNMTMAVMQTYLFFTAKP